MLALDNDIISLALDPDFGARVISLEDKRSGRDWLAKGTCDVSPGEDAVFGGALAWGWDECFPTISVCDGTAFGWDGMLRDHGVLWGRPWSCAADADAIEAVFETPGFRFARRLTLQGSSVIAAYRLTNRGNARFGFLYGQHMLLAARPGERLTSRGLSALMTEDGKDVGPLAASTDLTPVRDISAGSAAKLYAQLEGPCEIRLTGPDGALAVTFESPFLPALGIWACYGGWPASRPVHQLALEPTTAPAGDLSHKTVSWLHPGQTVQWVIRIALSPPKTGSQIT